MSIASSTVSGKYTVGAWKPWSRSRFAMSRVLTPVDFLIDVAEAMNSCLHTPGNGMS